MDPQIVESVLEAGIFRFEIGFFFFSFKKKGHDLVEKNNSKLFRDVRETVANILEHILTYWCIKGDLSQKTTWGNSGFLVANSRWLSILGGDVPVSGVRRILT